MPRKSTYQHEHPDCARAAAEARAELVAERDRLRQECDIWRERYDLADQTIHEAADLLLADIVEDDVAIDALVLDAIGRVLTQRTNLILAVKTLGGVERFAQCPVCLADRTNGEQHDEICPMVRSE